ncbi:aldolase [Hoyosella rhizosphaerae]|uniref:Aldolase n=1 Tax=Hoyosella rhizosphaerae TaxID=1755582 RepID=A0A916XC95_9ACTN|nr:aldolase/citrate lyase family protein [Hoyosella rhizosphaerae]MBN4927629.1 aldolase [Hoyosella rhizosphaerae]GGC62951.1 aldolase [Hoyosella rhizosphaerae]
MMSELLSRLTTILAPVDELLQERFPSVSRLHQPPHTVYVSAADANEQTIDHWRTAALSLLDAHRTELVALASPQAVARSEQRLRENPIADIRYDFEDGYGWRSDAEEDSHAREVGNLLAATGKQPQSCGIRPKGLAPHERGRAMRTLELVFDAAGGPPPGFVMTIPKLRHPTQVQAVNTVCEHFERAHGLVEGALKFELQIESPQAVVGVDGTTPIPEAIELGGTRLTGLHYGTFDYSAACGIAPQHQSLDHPVADHAKAVMLAAAAQTGVWVCDGSTNIVPTGSPQQRSAALKTHYDLVMRSLSRGYYQGWDMHPGHLVTRWLATFVFFDTSLHVALPRIATYLKNRSGDVMDEPATAQALATVVLRGLHCGAYGDHDITAQHPECTPAVLTELAARVIPNTSR